MSASVQVRTGIWNDHSRGWPYNILITEGKGYDIFLQLVLGVCLGAVWPALSRIINRIIQWVTRWIRFIRHGTGQDDESAPLLENGRPRDGSQVQSGRNEVPSGLGLPETPRSSSSSHSQYSSVPPSNTIAPMAPTVDDTGMDVEEFPKHGRSWTSTILSFGSLIMFTGWAVFNSVATDSPEDFLALASSKHCGSWALRRGVDERALADDALVQAAKERRAGEYEHACYGNQKATSSDECSFFAAQTIPSTVTHVDCPFRNQSLCAGGGLQLATRFTTGRADASLLGLNVARPPKFNRTTICVPLNIDQGFVTEIEPDKHHRDYRYEYHLGPRHAGSSVSNYTFRTAGDPFNYRVAAYSVSAYESTPYGPEHDYWTPIPDLDIITPGKDPYLTIMFISSCRIIYRGACEDYIFPATEEFPRASGRFRNADVRARPLACIDWNEVCTHDGVCDSMEEEVEGYGVAYEFTRSAMRQSTIFRSVKARLGNALLANEKVGDYESFRLDPQQWIIESRALFNTSLARMQFDALDVAIGAGHEKAPEFYEEVTPRWARGKMCGLYKFQMPKRYANINFWLLMGVPLLVLLILGLGLEAGSGQFTRAERPLVGHLLWFDIGVRNCIIRPYKAARHKAMNKASTSPSTQELGRPELEQNGSFTDHDAAQSTAVVLELSGSPPRER